MEKEKNDLYFIALVPPEDLAGEVTAIKKYFSERFNSMAALRSPPHITLHMPFKWPDKKLEKLRNSLQSFCTTKASFPVQLKNFNAFPPRVIYIEVIKSEALVHLQAELKDCFKKKLNIFNADRKDKPYAPHMTVAFRDLRKNKFHEAWPDFKEKKFEEEFSADHLTLLKHNGKFWEVFIQFPLKG